MKTFQAGNLQVHYDAAQVQLEIQWSGKSDMREPSIDLNPFIKALENHFNKHRDVVVDFRTLEYMNSSTVRPIISLLQNASVNSRQVVVRYDGQKNWQRLSFRAIKALAAAWSNVKVKGS